MKHEILNSHIYIHILNLYPSQSFLCFTIFSLNLKKKKFLIVLVHPTVFFTVQFYSLFQSSGNYPIHKGYTSYFNSTLQAQNFKMSQFHTKHPDVFLVEPLYHTIMTSLHVCLQKKILNGQHHSLKILVSQKLVLCLILKKLNV